MKFSALFRGDQAVLRGNFLLITISWIIMFAAQPIPDTYASLYLSSSWRQRIYARSNGFRRLNRSCACPVSRRLLSRQTWQKMAHSHHDFWVSHRQLIFHFCSFMAIYSDWLACAELLLNLWSSLDGDGY